MLKESNELTNQHNLKFPLKKKLPYQKKLEVFSLVQQ